MAGTKRIKDTAKSCNLEVELADIISLDDMEAVLTEVATGRDLYVSHITVLGRVRFPGNRHWHLKNHHETVGCLDLTYWPQGELFWISIRNYEPLWVHEAGLQLVPALEAALRSRRNESV